MTKIERAGLKAMAVRLMREGMTETDIAESLTRHCQAQHIVNPQGSPWTFSQTTVNRELKAFREQYKHKAKTKFDEFVDQHIESDLSAIQEAAEYHLGVARDAEQEHRIRSDAYMRMSKIIFDKIKTAMGGPDEAEVAEKIAEEIRKSADPDLMERIHALAQGSGDQRISGPH